MVVTVVLAEYGTTPAITRVEGSGNGMNIIDFTKETEDDIVANYTQEKLLML